jgi:alpha-tubulin suppressor-like RCC1 family protein
MDRNPLDHDGGPCAAEPRGGRPCSGRRTLPGTLWLAALGAALTACGDPAAPPSLVAAVRLSLDSLTIAAGASLYRLDPGVIDTAGRSVHGFPVRWRSTDTTRAVVDADGTIAARRPGNVLIIATADAHADTLRLTITTVTLDRLAISPTFGCGLAPDRRAYCWGSAGAVGALGVPDPSLIATGPVAVQGAPPLTALTAGWEHVCGLTPGGAAYCWGGNRIAQLGIGQRDDLAHSPSPVSGGLTFAAIEAGTHHTCAIATNGAAYCWAYNGEGRNGNGADGNFDLAPVPVAGGLTFLSIAAGLTHTCAIAADSAAYCWGGTGVGEVGASPYPPSCVESLGSTHCPTPVAVDGGLRFLALDVGAQFTCGIAADSVAYCWGYNPFGGTGNNTAQLNTPDSVPGGYRFTTIVTGHYHTCGIAAGAAAFCWGPGESGSLGDGSGSNSRIPVAVNGGLSFRSLAAGGGTSCGVTLASGAYCWGPNDGGVLGIGSYPAPSLVWVPTRVTGQP